MNLSRLDAGSRGFTLWILSGSMLFLTLFAILAITGSNRPVFLFVNQAHEITGGLFWANVTMLGDSLVGAVLLLPLVRRRPQAVWAGICAAILCAVVVQIVKMSLNVPRPPSVFPADAFFNIGPHPHFLSFPSGHTAAAFCFAAIMLFVFRSWIMRLAVLFVAASVGISRIAVGVHWPLDITAGAVFGLLSAFAGVHLSRLFPQGSSRLTMKIMGGLLLAGACVCVFVDFVGFPEGLPLQRFVGAAMIVFGGREFAALWREDDMQRDELGPV